MIRLTILFTLFIACAMNPIFAEETSLDVRTRGMRSYFYDLWKETKYGKSTNQIERAAWIIRNSSGQYDFVRWPNLEKGRQEKWRGALPLNVVGLVHTHPVSVDPRPSTYDVRLAVKMGIPIYTVSRDAIWKVSPDREITLEASRGWFRDVQVLSASADSRVQ